jgi:hypothetical protein
MRKISQSGKRQQLAAVSLRQGRPFLKNWLKC